MSFDIVKMFLSIDNVKGMDAARLTLDTRDSKKPSTECVLKGLQICLHNNNSIFDKSQLLQTKLNCNRCPEFLFMF